MDLQSIKLSINKASNEINPNSAIGELHIFLGAAPGVGKTWAMVDAAQQLRGDGVDVVIGHVDTHDRPEYSALLDGLEIIPLFAVDYEGVKLHEVDLNAILRRKPAVVLIDDLSHSNAPDCRNAKRYQDVLELLQANVTVYTTLNVSHVESIARAVEGLTGIKVREIVPDSLLTMAHTVRLIDLEPEELLKRLNKRLLTQNAMTSDVKSDDRTDEIDRALLEQATLNGRDKQQHLATLREIALHLTATRAAEEVHNLGLSDPDRLIAGGWVMVALSPNPVSQRLLSAADKFARKVNARVLAVYVECPNASLNAEDRIHIAAHLDLARALGAEVLTVVGTHIGEALVRTAQAYDVRRLVIGRSKPRRGGLFGRSSLIEDLLGMSESLDLLILS